MFVLLLIFSQLFYYCLFDFVFHVGFLKLSGESGLSGHTEE